MSQVGDVSNSLSMYQSETEQWKTEQAVNSFNKALNNGVTQTKELGKDEFLKILLTQLTNQDPTKPMEDTEFIAQMAQFSSLEQMTNMSESFESLSQTMVKNSALNILGRTVTLVEGDQVITGKVSAVSDDGSQLIKVNDRYYNYSSVKEIQE